MLKEVSIILAVIICIFLELGLYWAFPHNSQFVFVFQFLSLSLVLAYAAYYFKNLLQTAQKKKAGAFIVTLIIALMVSFVAAYLTFTHFAYTYHNYSIY